MTAPSSRGSRVSAKEEAERPGPSASLAAGNTSKKPAAHDLPILQSVSRACHALRLLSINRDGMRVKEIAEILELNLSTAYHLMSTLQQERMVAKEGRQYVLGPGVGLLATAFNSTNATPMHYVRPLRELAETTGETAYLSGWRNSQIMVLEVADGSHAMRVVELSQGYSDDIHARASAKLLLAYADTATQQAALNEASFRKLTANTITDKESLYEELKLIRASGIARDRQEFAEGVECVSAPIFEAGVVVACFTISIPASRYESSEPQLIAALKRAVTAASSPDLDEQLLQTHPR